MDTSAWDTISTIVQTIWGTFFAWMPLSLQIAFGAVFAVCIAVLILKVAALVLDAIPFL